MRSRCSRFQPSACASSWLHDASSVSRYGPLHCSGGERAHAGQRHAAGGAAVAARTRQPERRVRHSAGAAPAAATGVRVRVRVRVSRRGTCSSSDWRQTNRSPFTSRTSRTASSGPRARPTASNASSASGDAGSLSASVQSAGLRCAARKAHAAVVGSRSVIGHD
eukprot:276644-Prymnesium_polylepis.1